MYDMKWPPIENNPEVLTALISRFGFDETFGFHDVYSLDDEDLLAFVPRPAIALVLVFPITEHYETQRRAATNGHTMMLPKDNDGNIIWFKQTIGNACGMMAILHALANNEHLLDSTGDLYTFLQKAKSLNETERTKAIESSSFIESAHLSAAQSGQSTVIDAEEEVDLHFVAFVKSGTNGHIYELDGRQNVPIDHGPFEGNDLLSAQGRNLIKDFVRRASGSSDEMNFSLCALAPAT